MLKSMKWPSLRLKKTSWALLISILALFLRLYLAYTGPVEFDELTYFAAAVQYNQAFRGLHASLILNFL